MKKIFISCLVFVISFELLLRISGVMKTTTEKQGNGYYTFFRQEVDSWFHTYQPNDTVIYEQSEFSYINYINEFGNRERSIEFFKDTNAIKVFCLGDSFTEGDGAPYDSTWVKRLENLSNENCDTNFIFYNAGVCGSDVFYTKKLLTEKLIKLKPDYVIESINDSDLPDVVYRGGKERFNKDGTTSGKVGPRWEKYYKYSHIFRFIVAVFFNYDENLFVKGKEFETEFEALQLVKNQVIETADWCKNNNIPYIAFLHPVPSGWKHQEDIYIAFLDAFEDIPYVHNLTPKFKKSFENRNIKDYSWEENAHFNGKGYYVMGDIYYETLIKEFFNHFYCETN